MQPTGIIKRHDKKKLYPFYCRLFFSCSSNTFYLHFDGYYGHEIALIWLEAIPVFYSTVLVTNNCGLLLNDRYVRFLVVSRSDKNYFKLQCNFLRYVFDDIFIKKKWDRKWWKNNRSIAGFCGCNFNGWSACLWRKLKRICCHLLSQASTGNGFMVVIMGWEWKWSWKASNKIIKNIF